MNMIHLQNLVRRPWQIGTSSRDFYPRPQPLPRTRSFWTALGLVLLAVMVYSIYFCIFLMSKQNAFQTNGEDLGIMDQALWNLLHGSMLHQTICNVITDTNCYGINGVNRFAIHFEPILLPTALLYLLWSSPKALLIFQTFVVASGAFPAFWLARLRLRNNWAAVPFALLYLLYPAQQYAVNFDFHAETLTIALLLFVLYFLYERKNLWLFVSVVLCLACKEEIAGIIFMLGFWTLLLQQRWRIGTSLIALALGWTSIGLIIVHYFSPVGHSLLATRYAYLGQDPVQVALTILTHPINIIKGHLLEPSHMLYLRKLLVPTGYIPIVAPWILILATPTLTLNLLSSTPNMYSGDFQYNAEIVPILIFASIEATILIIWLAHWTLVYIEVKRDRQEPAMAPRKFTHKLASTFQIQTGILALVLCSMLLCAFHSTTEYNVYNAMPYAHGFVWPQVTTHDLRASHFLAEIPAAASVSTQTNLVPHLSERKSIYLFPYAVGDADYILLDAPGYTYPFQDYDDYASTVKAILQHGEYGVVDIDDGYILLQHGFPSSDITAALHVINANAHDIHTTPAFPLGQKRKS